MLEDYTEYFTLAIEVALTGRQQVIFALRYGFMDGTSHTLADIGQNFGISRERVRQILSKAMRKLVLRARREYRKQEYEKPCGRLLLYIMEIIKPDEPGVMERTFDFALGTLGHLPLERVVLPLLTRLICPTQESAQSFLDGLLQQTRTYRAALLQEARRRKSHNRFKAFIDAGIWWPKKIQHVSLPTSMSRERDVSFDDGRHAGTYFSVKLNREVQYESLLEMEFFLKLENLDEIVFYQEQPLVIEYMMEEKRRLYYPDVYFVFDDGRSVVAEIKPKHHMALYANLCKWSGLRKFCQDNGFGLLITDGRVYIQSLMRSEIPADFEDALLTALNANPLSWAEYKQISNSHGAKWEHLIAAILRYKLVWSLQPFVLRLS